MDNCETEAELDALKDELKDRFGPVPQQVEDLFVTVRCRKLAVDLGFEKMSLKNDSLRCYFINKNDSPYFESEIFKKILSFVQTETNKAKLKQVGKLFLLTVDPIESMNAMFRFLNQLHHYCFQR